MEIFGSIIGLVIGLGIHIAIAMWAASIAENKGYSGALAGILGFLFGWIVPLIYYFLPDTSGGRESSSAPRIVSGTEAKRQQFSENQAPGSCRVCGFANAPREGRCYQCGNVLTSY